MTGHGKFWVLTCGNSLMKKRAGGTLKLESVSVSSVESCVFSKIFVFLSARLFPFINRKSVD